MDLNENLLGALSSTTTTGSRPSRGSPGLDSLDTNLSGALSRTLRGRGDVDINSLAAEEGAENLVPVINAIYGQESGNGANGRTSVDGAHGGMQIIADTFRRYARPGEVIDDAVDNARAGIRYIKDLANKFGSDPAKIAAGYFSGEGNVNPGEGSAWKQDRADGNGKSTSGYVGDVLQRLGVTPEPSKQSGPDFSKAPKWSDIVAKPAYAKLTPQERELAKTSYFDYWVAPQAGKNAAALRQQFLANEDLLPEQPGTWDKIKGAVADAAQQGGEMLSSAFAARGAGLVNAERAAPITPAEQTVFNAQYNAATPEQRVQMEKDEGKFGRFATQKNVDSGLSRPWYDTQLSKLTSGLGTSIAEGFRKQGQAIALRATDTLPDSIDFAPSWADDREIQLSGGVRGWYEKALGIHSNEELRAAKTKAAQSSIDAIKKSDDAIQAATPKDMTMMERGIRGASESIVQNAPGLAIGAVTMNPIPALAAMGIQTSASSYSEARSKGLDPDRAARYAAIDGVLEVATEAIPAGKLLSIFGAKDVAGIKKQLAHFVAGEMVGEQVATFTQSLNAQAHGLDEELAKATTVGEQARIHAERAALTAISTIVQSGVQGGSAAALRHGYNKYTTAQASNAANQAQTNAMNAWQNNGLTSRLRPPAPPAASSPPAANGGPPAPPAPPASSAPASLPPGAPPAPAGSSGGPAPSGDKAVVDQAEIRMADLQQRGIDNELTPEERAEMAALSDADGDPAKLRQLYGLTQAPTQETRNNEDEAQAQQGGPAQRGQAGQGSPAGEADGRGQGPAGQALDAGGDAADSNRPGGPGYDGLPAEGLVTPQGIQRWDQENRTRRNDEWFEGYAQSISARNAEVGRASRYNAHGMAKERTLTGAYQNLVNILTNGLDPNRGGGRLYVDALGSSNANAGGGATASGAAYADGPFQIVARQGVSEIRGTADIGGILVNQAIANTGVIEALRQQFPDLIIESYSGISTFLDQMDAQSRPASNTTTETAYGPQTPEAKQAEAQGQKPGQEPGAVTPPRTEREARLARSNTAGAKTYSVDTEDNGTFEAKVLRSKDGGVTIFIDGHTIEHNAAFSQGKTDGELLRYSFEPLGFRSATEAAPVAPKTEREAIDRRIAQNDKHQAGNLAITEVPVDQLTLSNDVPQFKSDANSDGVVEPLGGKFERTGVAPIQIWRRLDGRLEVISGRHRLDLARRSGEQTIPSQIHNEADGFDSTQASILDAELNIRDGQGKVKDYVSYFQGTKLSKQAATERGLLARSTGKRAYAIATGGSDALVSAHRANSINDEGAYQVASFAPNDERLQAVGIRALQDGKSAESAVNLMQAVKAMAGDRGDTNGDMFGFDDSAMREAEEMARIATRKQRDIAQRVSSVSGAARNPALAKKEGVDVRDPEALKKRIEELKREKSKWDNWSTSPDLIAQIRADMTGGGFNLNTQTEADLQKRGEEQKRAEAEKADAERVAKNKADADSQAGMFDLTGQGITNNQDDMFGNSPRPSKTESENKTRSPADQGEKLKYPPGPPTAERPNGVNPSDLIKREIDELNQRANEAAQKRINALPKNRSWAKKINEIDYEERRKLDAEREALQKKWQEAAKEEQADPVGEYWRNQPFTPEEHQAAIDIIKVGDHIFERYYDGSLRVDEVLPPNEVGIRFLKVTSWIDGRGDRKSGYGDQKTLWRPLFMRDGELLAPHGYHDANGIIEQLEILPAGIKSKNQQNGKAAPKTEKEAKANKNAKADPSDANTGATPEHTAQIGNEFDEAAGRATEDGFRVHHLFDSPGKDEVVDLAKKAGAYAKKEDDGTGTGTNKEVWYINGEWLSPKDGKTKIAEWKAHAEAQAKTGKNSNKIVISLFDLTGDWSRPWEEAGYQVFRFDIQNMPRPEDATWADPESDNYDEELAKSDDVNSFSTQFFNSVFGAFDGNDVHAILAACPCTDFASSGARHFAAKDKDGSTIESVNLVKQTLATIEHFKPAVWAIENPVGRIGKLAGLPPWRLSFNPFLMGNPHTKKTLLWGRFNGDLPVAPVEPTEGSKMHSKYGGKSQKTKNARSETPEGFAYSFFMANNAIDHPVQAIANKYDRLDKELIKKAVDAGLTEQDISDVLDDPYYMDLNDKAAEAALLALIDGAATPEYSVDPYDNTEVRPGTVDAQLDAGRAAVNDLRRRLGVDHIGRGTSAGRGSASVLGSRIIANFQAGKPNSLIGRTVQTPLDLAALAQVYRDPRFETIRVIYTDAAGLIVGENAYTSRLPASAAVPTDLPALVKSDIKRLGAVGYYVLHNHPSGRAIPSKADINFTTALSRLASGFQSHVVIDHNEYSTIDRFGATEVIPAPQFDGKDFFGDSAVPHELLGRTLENSKDLAEAAKSLQIKDGYAALIFINAKMQTQLIIDLPMSAIQDQTKSGIAKAQAIIRRMARETGSGGFTVVVLPDGQDVDKFRTLVKTHTLADVVSADGNAVSKLTFYGGHNFLREKEKKAIQVQEPGYHGSPYYFHQFDLGAIGNGEGAQSYGWGIYTAGQKGTATYYRNKLSSIVSATKDGQKLEGHGDLAEAYFKPGRIVDGYGGPDRVLEFKRGDDPDDWSWVKVQHIDPKTGEPVKGIDGRPRAHRTFPDSKKLESYLKSEGYDVQRGHLYTFEVPDDAITKMMLWDTAIKQMPDYVQARLRSLLMSDAVEARALEDFDVKSRKELADKILSPDATGKEIYESLSDVFRTDKGASEALRDAGIPGLRYLDGSSRKDAEGSYNTVIWDQGLLDQISNTFNVEEPQTPYNGQQSASGQPPRSAGPAQQGLPGIQPPTPPARPPYQPQAPLTGGQGGSTWSVGAPDRTDNFIYEWQNRQIDLKRVQQAISRVRSIQDQFNAYMREELFHGRVARRTEMFLERELRPLLQDMKLKGITQDELESYLWARHAPERNTQISTINPQMPDGGSGLTNAQAADYMAGNDVLSANGTLIIKGLKLADRGRLDQLAARIDAISAGTKQVLIQYGLESPSTIAAWDATYQHYVPLYRQDLDGVTPIGQGLSVKGSASKRAMGSTRGVVDILAHLAIQREAALTRGEKNRVSVALYGLARQNPNPAIWDVDKIPMIKSIDKTTGLVTMIPDPNYKNRENTLVLRLNGQDRAIFFNDNDPRAARMVEVMKNLDVNFLNDHIARLAGVTRFFAAINTQYNPVFGFVNGARDVQAALMNLSSTEAAGLQRQVMANVAPAMRAIWGIERGGVGGGTWALAYRDLLARGGTTGYREMFRVGADRAKALKKEIADLNAGTAKKLGKETMKVLDDFNTAIENGTRLAVYKAALDAGIPPDRAASIAKNITVNFNRKGHTGSTGNSLYAFFNAGIQGTARVAQTLSGPAGRKIMVAGVIIGMAQTAIGLAAFGDDEWENIPEFIKQRNLIIPTGKYDYLQIPMPLGFNIFPTIGRIATDMAIHPGRKVFEKTANMIASLTDSLLPVDSVTPTPLQLWYDLKTNKDFTDRDIAKENVNPLAPTPGFTRAKDSSSFVSRKLAEGVNWATSGTKYTPGHFSPTPDQIDYFFGFATGGVGRELNKAYQASELMLKGEDVPEYKKPLVGRFYGRTDEDVAVSGRFWATVKDLNILENEIKGRQKDHEDTAELRAQRPESRLISLSNTIERDVSQMRAQRHKIEFDEKMVEADRTTRLKDIDDRILDKMRRFNDRVSEDRKLAREKSQ